MRHAAFTLVPLLALAACATPRQACIADATRDLGQITRQVAQAQDNIARGYAIDSRDEVRLERDTCRGETDDGVGFTYECVTPRTVRVPVRVPINALAEQARLQSLLTQQAALQAQSQPAVQACIATYPE